MSNIMHALSYFTSSASLNIKEVASQLVLPLLQSWHYTCTDTCTCVCVCYNSNRTVIVE